MGLDMYLDVKRFMSGYDFNPEEKKLNSEIRELLNLTRHNPTGFVEVSVNVAYWRKANAIHSWFVENCQDGVDDCREAYVSREQLNQLYDTVVWTLENRDASRLPPCAGFFFGSTDVDDWYWEDMEDTREMLGRILEDKTLTEFSYRASW